MKIRSLLASGLLTCALALTGHAQLSVSYVPTSGIALTFQSSAATLLGYAETSNPVFTIAGQDFSLIPNYGLGEIIVGSGVDGTYFANVTFLARESLRPNHFGVSDSGLDGYGAGGITLFKDYTTADLPITRAFSATGYEEVNFWHYADKPGYTGTYFMDEALSFRTWEAVDVDANRIYTIFGIDDLRSSAIDFDDGLFLIERNLLPIGLDNPVPEPSFYGVLGGVLLLGVVAYRRFRFSAGVVTCGVQR